MGGGGAGGGEGLKRIAETGCQNRGHRSSTRRPGPTSAIRGGLGAMAAGIGSEAEKSRQYMFLPRFCPLETHLDVE